MSNNKSASAELPSDVVSSDVSIKCIEGNRLKCIHISVAPYPLSALAVMDGESPVGCSCTQYCSRYRENKEREESQDCFVPSETLEERLQRDVEELVEIDAIIQEEGVKHTNSWRQALSAKTKEFMDWRRKHHPEWLNKEE